MRGEGSVNDAVDKYDSGPWTKEMPKCCGQRYAMLALVLTERDRLGLSEEPYASE